MHVILYVHIRSSNVRMLGCRHSAMAHLFKDNDTYERFKRAYDASADISDGAASNIVANYDQMMSCMTESGMVQELLLPPHVVGVHVANRGGKMMSGAAMMARGARIVTVGTSKALCGPSRCVCMEDPPNSTITYDRMVQTAASCPMFAKPSKLIKYGSLGGSHLNAFLNSVNAMCPTTESVLQQTFTDVGATSPIDKARIFNSDRVLADICTQGLRWSVVHHSMGTTFPMLADMIQKALNTEHHIGQGETWEQILYQAATIAKHHIKSSTGAPSQVNWDAVAKAITKSVPSCAYDLQHSSIMNAMSDLESSIMCCCPCRMYAVRCVL